FRGRDPDSLAEATIRVLTEPGLGERLIADAHEHLRCFDWDEVAARTESAYSSVLAGTARRAT
ncbi:MAG: glycosyltransferase, partial [Solirubrobacterales bacterium]